MRKLMLTVSALALGVGAAFAADLPVKAPRVVAPPVSGYGWYVGIGTEAAVAQSSVSGNNVFATSLVNGNLTAAGGAVGGDVGYIDQLPNGWKWRFEAGVMYQNITGSITTTTGSASVASRWSATQEFDIDFAVVQKISSVVGNLINFPSFTPSLPANVVVVQATPWEYVGVGAREFGVDGNFFGQQGSNWSVAPMIKTGFMWQTADSSGKPNGGAIDTYAWVSFPQRGVTLNNLFSAGGAPLGVSGAAQMGTQYGLGLKYDFGI